MAQTYDASRWGAIHICGLGKVAANVANTNPVARFAAFTTGKVLDVFTLIHNGAGTDVTSGFTIKKGTTSIGAIACSSGAAGTIAAATLTDTDITSTDVINIHTTRSDTNLQGFLYVIWQEKFAG